MDLYYQHKNKLWTELFKETSLASMVYTPYFLAINQHIHSIIFFLFDIYYAYTCKIPSEREIFQLSDKGILAIDWFLKDCKLQNIQKEEFITSKRPLIAIVPGVTGDSTTLYCKSLIKAAHAKNFDCVVINYRGMSGVPLKSLRIYTAADFQSIQEPMEYIYDKYCQKQKRLLFGIGVSMGTTVLSLYMAHAKEKCKITAAFHISSIYNTHIAMAYLNKTFFGFYDKLLGNYTLDNCKTFLKEYDEMLLKSNLKKELATPQLQKVKNISYDYNMIVTRLEGFESLSHYFDASTIAHHMKDIKQPSFYLSAIDDQFFGSSAIPFEESQNENIIIGVTKAGGHVCYLQGTLLPQNQWFTQPALEFFNFFIKQRKNDN